MFTRLFGSLRHRGIGDPDQERWRREVRRLRTTDWHYLDADERILVSILERRVKEGLPILERHGRTVDEIGARIQCDEAW